MATRRIKTHSKSRNGCIRCKARRLKCDESRPQCERCQRSGKECSYNADSHENALWRRAGSVLDQPDSGTFDALDLIFMHHYITCTAIDLVGPKGSQTLWQNLIPVEAHVHPLVMHGLLALAGIDMARRHFKSPQTRHLCNKYRARALSHQQIGLGLFQKTLTSKIHLRQSEIPPLMLFNLILIISTFAIPFTDDVETSIDEVLSIFALCRGGSEVYSLLHDPWAKQPLKAMSFVGDEPTEPRLSEAVMLHLDTCLARQERKVNRDALEHLIGSSRFHQDQDSVVDIRMVGHWPALCCSVFMEEVRQLKPDSLAVLAQYSHILNLCRRHWWIQSWPEILLRAIDRCLEDEDKIRVGWDLEASLASLQPQEYESASSC